LNIARNLRSALLISVNLGIACRISGSFHRSRVESCWPQDGSRPGSTFAWSYLNTTSAQKGGIKSTHHSAHQCPPASTSL
jgi:hypothetical protein